MLFWTIIKVALKSIAANKLRSLLTMLGIIIGVGAVIAMLGLGAGTEEKVLASVRQMGANMLTIRAGQRGGGSGVYTGTANTLSIEDAEALLRELPKEVEMVTPEVSTRVQAKFMNKNTRVSMSGIAPTAFTIRNFVVEKGHAFSDADVHRAARVAILGPKTATDLFGEMSPIGETVKMNGINFLIIGVTKAKGDQGWYNPDDMAFAPFTTVMRQIAGKTSLDQIYVRVREGVDMAEAQEKVTQLLRRQHRLQSHQEEDFSVRNLQEMADSQEAFTKVFRYLLIGVASVSLLVGGIGIMNIMLVSVTERTREIGIRKALGARRVDLLTQFLLEAITISLSGGALGVGLGVGAIVLFNHLTEKFSGEAYGAKILVWPIALAFGFSVLVGVFFGWYPARKAARLDPIEALRYE